ncbi:hypothetical protein [Streptomyces sp. TM32]|nr:hypothetical protein [Streptomyces sp. TM32]
MSNSFVRGGESFATTLPQVVAGRTRSRLLVGTVPRARSVL